MNFIANFNRNRAIKSYVKKLPSLLEKDYGKSKAYTPKQIKRSIDRSGLNATYACYGIAMFSGGEAFDEYHQEIGESCSYDAMRSEIADRHFGGNADFEISDAVSLSSDFGSGADDGGWSDGGGDGGGNGD